MRNLFISDNYPQTEPAELLVGSRWAWVRPDITSVYPVTEYTLKYAFSDLEKGTNFEVLAAKIDGAHVVEVAAADTQNRNQGEHKWTAIIVRDSDGEEVSVDEGLTALTLSTSETGSHVYRTLMAIRATIEKKASKDQLSYTINGRSLQRYTFDELSRLETQYTRRYKAEKDALDRKNGRKGKHRVLTRLGA